MLSTPRENWFEIMFLSCSFRKSHRLWVFFFFYMVKLARLQIGPGPTKSTQFRSVFSYLLPVFFKVFPKKKKKPLHTLRTEVCVLFFKFTTFGKILQIMLDISCLLLIIIFILCLLKYGSWTNFSALEYAVTLQVVSQVVSRSFLKDICSCWKEIDKKT